MHALLTRALLSFVGRTPALLLSCIALACSEDSDPRADDSDDSDDSGTTDCTNATQCDADEVCAKTDCASKGECRETAACGEIYAPVCGCNGMTYGNACEATNAGAGVASEGECEQESGCGAAPPEAGSECTPPWTASGPGFPEPFAHCTWGDDPRPECRTAALCRDGVWVLTEPGAECERELLPEACPEQPASAGTECDDLTLACWYAGGERCWCSPCINGSEYPICQDVDPPQWACREPAAGCPEQFPQAGATCDAPGTSCGPDCELAIVCDSGVWQWNQGMCPICAAPDTPIATPDGERAIASLRVGDLVYSTEDAAIVVVPIERIGSTLVGVHQVLDLELSNGERLEISPGHPSFEGRALGEFEPGELLDTQARIVSSRLVPYRHLRTYDILPQSSSGAYFAAGTLIGSSLAPPLVRSSQTRSTSDAAASH